MSHVLRMSALATALAVAASAAIIAGPGAVSAAAAPATSGPAAVTGNVWKFRTSLSTGAAGTTTSFGRSTDLPVLGDWDGDGTPTPGAFRNGVWLLRNSLTTGPAQVTRKFGVPGDTPIVGDWDGDGDDDLGAVRAGVWYEDFGLSGGRAERRFRFGRTFDTPVAGDWDGAADGSRADEPGLVYAGTWRLADRPVPAGIRWTFTFGRAGDAPVVGRWQPDATHDQVGFVRDGRWHLRHGLTTGTADRTFAFGHADDWFATSGRGGTSVRQSATHYTYTVGTKGTVGANLGVFTDTVRKALGDARGWSLGRGIRYSHVTSGARLRVWLASPAEVDRADPECSAQWSCRVGPDVYINERRWNYGTATWSSRPLYDYRRYVLNHEVGHWLGLGHASCSGSGAPAPVMLQQSKTLDGCKPTLWPSRAELARARTLHIN